MFIAACEISRSGSKLWWVGSAAFIDILRRKGHKGGDGAHTFNVLCPIEMGMLEEKIVEKGNGVSLYVLRDELFCTRVLTYGYSCNKPTRWAVVIEKQDGDFLVFPVCEEHLPEWAKPAVLQAKKQEVQKDGKKRKEVA